MKLLLCHNYYQQPGGEDQSFADEARLLESHGHEVVRYTLHNDAIEGMNRLSVSRRTIWNRDVYRQLRDLIRRERPVLMHCTNTFPLLSPAAYYAAWHEDVPVVQSLRNYRLLCPNGLLLRDGKPCEQCLTKKFAWPGVLHGCYRQSRTATTLVAAMSGIHRALRTWRRTVQLYFTPTEFARRKFIQSGLPEEQVAVKPNFVYTDPGVGGGAGGYAVFVGRLSEEKGIGTLLDAWSEIGGRLKLKIVGEGPLGEHVRTAARENPAIEWLGHLPNEEVLSLVGDATCLVMPSVWYETFGRTIIEGFASGTPVVASRLGAMAELVVDGRTGLLFEPGNARDLAAKINQLLDMPQETARLREAAREEYLSKYTAELNYTQLMSLYARVSPVVEVPTACATQATL